jgi:hypothetical protein
MQKAPDFFIIGQPKSGTTALYEMLRRSPQIRFAVASQSAILREVSLDPELST